MNVPAYIALLVGSPVFVFVFVYTSRGSEKSVIRKVRGK